MEDSGMLYVVEMAIVGSCKVPVVAATPEEAMEKAVECVSPVHATSWEYVPEDCIGLEQVTVVDGDTIADAMLALHA